MNIVAPLQVRGGRGRERTERILAALDRRGGQGIPIGEWVWSDFVDRCRAELGTGGDFDPDRYWDLDYVVLTPNHDPRIAGIEVIEESPTRTLVRTGFGSTIEVRAGMSMPAYVDFEVRTFEDLEQLHFDDPSDERRFQSPIDDLFNSVGDRLRLGQTSFVDRVASYADDFFVFGAVCDPYEMLWRIVGTEPSLLMLGEDPARIGRFAERLGDYLVGLVHGQVAAAGNALSGLFIWGDVAYDHGMLFSPATWRTLFKPQVWRICEAAHSHGLKIAYHGDGDDRAIWDDLVECGIDAKQPLEAKAGLDVVDALASYGDRLSFMGNIDVRVLATNDLEKVRREVLRKLEAGAGGGYIISSDHSIPGDVSPETFAFYRQLVEEHGGRVPRTDIAAQRGPSFADHG